MRHRLLIALLVLALCRPVSAQLGSVPYTFSPGTTILSAEVNANFTTAYANALNRTGGTMTGTLTAQVILPDGDNTRNFGSAAASWASGWFDGTLTVATISLTTLTCTGCITSTNVANDTLLDADVNSAAAIAWSKISKSGSSLSDLATRAVANLSDGSNVALLNAANTFTGAGLNLTHETSARWAFTDVTDGVAGYVGVAQHVITGAAIDSLGLRGEAGVAVSGDGGASVGMTLSSAHVLSVTGFGSHAFSAGGAGSNALKVRNTTDGTGNSAFLAVGNDASENLGVLQAFASSFTTSGPDVASGVKLGGTGAGGLSLSASHASGAIRFYAGGTTEWLSLSTTGVLTVSGFGAHVFSAGGTGSNILRVRNTTAGTGNSAYLAVGNDAAENLGIVQGFSSTFTTSGPDVAAGVKILGTGAGGLSIVGSDASGAIRFYAGGTGEDVRLHASGGVSVGDTTDPGATNFRVAGASTLVGAVSTGALTATTLDTGQGANELYDMDQNVLTTSAVRFDGGITTDSSAAGSANLRVAGTSTLIGNVRIGGTNLTDSVAAPSVSSGASSVAGKDFAFRVTGMVNTTAAVINFGNTYASAPVCVAAAADQTVVYFPRITTTTTQATLSWSSSPASGDVNVICRGY